jgi:uncharacterized protein YqeY
MNHDAEVSQLVSELIYFLDMEEESDMGRVFHPTTIYSCRVMDGQRINEILKRLKALTPPHTP